MKPSANLKTLSETHYPNVPLVYCNKNNHVENEKCKSVMVFTHLQREKNYDNIVPDLMTINITNLSSISEKNTM